MAKAELKISNDLSLPLEAVTNTHLILARRRVGKSYTGAVMAEEMVHAGLPWVALDPTGVWWGLTSSADGKSEGLPVIVIGGPHGHIPLEPSAGKVIANLVVDHPGWYVIDFSRLDHRSDEIQFAADFGHQLYRRKQRKPSAVHLFVDEADMFIPQKLPKKAVEMLNAYDAIVRRGGVYGMGTTLISQRPALVNKDVTTQCETLIALQTSAPEDQDPILDWVSRNGTKEQVDQIKKTLASLKAGESWIFSPNSDVFQKIKIRTRETFNSSATPKPGAKPIEPKVFANIDMAKLGEEIAATVERSKQEDPEYLHRQIAQLRRELAEKQNNIPKSEMKVERVEVPVVSDEQIKELGKHLSRVYEITQDIGTLREELDQHFNGDLTQLNTVAVSLSSAIEAAKKPVFVGMDWGKTKDQTVRAIVKTNKEDDDSIHIEGEATSAQQRILDALAWLESVGLYNPKRIVVASLAGRSSKSSQWGTDLSDLRKYGLVDYPGGDSLSLTDTGRSSANQQSSPITTDGLQSAILARLPRLQARILKILIDNYPNPVNREALAQQAGQSIKSSSWGSNLSDLRNLGVIDYPSSTQAVALPVLFLK